MFAEQLKPGTRRVSGPVDDERPLLSARLRAQTAPLHAQTERQFGLPGAIRSRDDYVAWLGRFLGLYEPLERSLAAIPGWGSLGFTPPAQSHTACLLDDLAVLGVDPRQVPRAAPALLPELPTFAHALGALYVLEGATLGGRVILRELEARVGAPISEATSFLGGRGVSVEPKWHSFRTALDRFGCEQPQFAADVVVGAERTFRAMLGWFAPFCALAADHR